MKKNRKKIYVVIALLLFVLVSLMWWQRNNISAIINAISYSSEEIEQKIDDNRKELADALNKNGSFAIRDFTAEEEEQIRSGQLSIADAVNRIINEKDQQEAKLKDKKSNEQKIDKVIGDSVAQMYGIKANYIGRLGAIESSAINEFISLPSAQRNLSSKQRIASKYMGQASSLESQCDSQVEKILSSMKVKLKELGGDTSIIKIMRDSYYNEKSLKKAYYLGRLNN